jgi:hypothetical protein
MWRYDGHVPSHRALWLLRREHPCWRNVKVRTNKYLNNLNSTTEGLNMKNESSRLIARAGPLALAVLTINVLLALPADAETQVARYSVADQEVRAVESQLSLALSSVDVDQPPG